MQLREATWWTGRAFRRTGQKGNCGERVVVFFDSNDGYYLCEADLFVVRRAFSGDYEGLADWEPLIKVDEVIRLSLGDELDTTAKISMDIAKMADAAAKAIGGLAIAMENAGKAFAKAIDADFVEAMYRGSRREKK